MSSNPPPEEQRQTFVPVIGSSRRDPLHITNIVVCQPCKDGNSDGAYLPAGIMIPCNCLLCVCNIYQWIEAGNKECPRCKTQPEYLLQDGKKLWIVDYKNENGEEKWGLTGREPPPYIATEKVESEK
ncbi:hypothetical protein EDC01DRAFT_636916 [Geopyxis carbonaria]|nr:hypothetical protein EDC01DRAFT_636916 [Geopyxis carbonaria]